MRTIEVGGIASAYEAIQEAIDRAPQRPELMQFARQLVPAKKFSIAGQIVSARLAVEPNDVWALLLDAKMIMTLVNGGQWGKERLVDAEHSLGRVLELSPDWLEPRLLWADIPRFGGDPATSATRWSTFRLASAWFRKTPTTRLAQLVRSWRSADSTRRARQCSAASRSIPSIA